MVELPGGEKSNQSGHLRDGQTNRRTDGGTKATLNFLFPTGGSIIITRTKTRSTTKTSLPVLARHGQRGVYTSNIVSVDIHNVVHASIGPSRVGIMQ